MVKVFERDIDALEEVHIHVRHDKKTRIHIYSATDEFVVYIYGYKINSEFKHTLDAVASDMNNGVVLDIEKSASGELVISNMIHGDEAYELQPVDTKFVSNEYHKLMITANDGVTIKYYEH